ncbi:MAG: hypothetical protein EPO64_05105 [Nitrospirae bacterium]|nr:MAG: hypothetical protein EPO64_05105 [Nitrospirota bacterium]
MATNGISLDRITIPRWTIQRGPKDEVCPCCGEAAVLVKADDRHVTFCACYIVSDQWIPRKRLSS